MTNPYADLPDHAFWRKAVAGASPFAPEGIVTPRFALSQGMRIATAGSCFAQHIARFLRGLGVQVVDTEPPPAALEPSQHETWGFSMYSARFGNIYTAAQLAQLAAEAAGHLTLHDIAWARGDRFVDALRPSVEPEGLDTPEEVIAHRAWHLTRVREMLLQADVMIFTLGLTEAWRDRATGTVWPTAPGTIAGVFDPQAHEFHNFTVGETVALMRDFQRIANDLRRTAERPALKILLTVSPVPLTATASGAHVLAATTLSKAVLRAAAAELVAGDPDFDYFPSYEIITNPAAHGAFYETNLRSVRAGGVDTVMRCFLDAHPHLRRAKDTPSGDSPTREDVQCEEALMEAFGK